MPKQTPERIIDRVFAPTPGGAIIAGGNTGGIGGGGVTDHGNLTGLLDDDHTQYYNQARGDARYSQIGHNIVGSDHTVTGSQYQIVGLTAANTLGLLTPTTDGDTNVSTILRSGATGDLEIRKLADAGYQAPNPFTNGFQIYELPGDSDKYRLNIGRIEADELIVKVFTADETRVRRGSDWLTPTFGVVVADDYAGTESYTVPAENSTVNIWFEDSIHFTGALFDENEWVLIEFVNRSTGFTALEIWGQVSTYTTDVNHDDQQRWTFTNRTAGVAGFELQPGTMVMGYGASGDGWIYRTTLSGGPRAKYATWTGTNPRDGTVTTQVQLGDLTDVSGSVYGDLSGQYGLWAADSVYIEGANLGAAGGDFYVNDDGLNIKVESLSSATLDLADYSDKITFTTNSLDPSSGAPVLQLYALRYEQTAGNYVAHGYLTAQAGGSTTNYTSTLQLEALGTSTSAFVRLDDNAGSPNVTISAMASTVPQDIDIAGNLVMTVGASDILPGADSTVDIGSSAKYFSRLYARDIYADTFHGDLEYTGTLTGNWWAGDGSGNMTIDIDAVGAYDLIVTNSEAGGSVNLDVQGTLDVQSNIVVGGTVDGVDVASLSSAYTTHSGATAAHGATGAVVGTTNTQTLTNKTLASPTVTGTLAGAAATFSSTLGVTGAITATSAAFSSTVSVSGDFTFDEMYNSDSTSNLRLGYFAGNANTSSRMTAVGYYAGSSNTGSDLVALGWRAGAGNTGNRTTVVGVYAGDGGTAQSNNTFLGYKAGYLNSQASITMVGYLAGQSNTGLGVSAFGAQAADGNSGDNVFAFGLTAAKNNSGNSGVFVGSYSGENNTGGQLVGVGMYTMQNATGNRSVAIGYQAGLSNTGSDSLFLGDQVGKNNTSAYRIAIGNRLNEIISGTMLSSAATSSLSLNAETSIEDDLIVEQYAKIADGAVIGAIATPAYMLDVRGDANITTDLSVSGDVYAGTVRGDDLNIVAADDTPAWIFRNDAGEIRSSTFALNGVTGQPTAGLMLTDDSVYAQDGIFRGKLAATVQEIGEVALHGGTSLWTAGGAFKLKADLTITDVAEETYTMSIDNPTWGLARVAEVGDVLKIQTFALSSTTNDASGDKVTPWNLWQPQVGESAYFGSITAYFVVDSYSIQATAAGDRYYQYGVTLKSATAGGTIQKGAAVANLRIEGSGAIYLTSSEYGAPYIRTATIDADPWDGDEGTAQTQTGALWNIGYLDANEFGFIAGSDIDDSTAGRIVISNKRAEIKDIDLYVTDSDGDTKASISTSTGLTMYIGPDEMSAVSFRASDRLIGIVGIGDLLKENPINAGQRIPTTIIRSPYQSGGYTLDGYGYASTIEEYGGAVDDVVSTVAGSRLRVGTTAKGTSEGSENIYNWGASMIFTTYSSGDSRAEIVSNYVGVGTFGGTIRLNTSIVSFPSIPTSDPGIDGALWSDSGTVKVSSG